MSDLRVFFKGLTPTVDTPFYYFRRSRGGTLICTDYKTSKDRGEGVAFKKQMGLTGYDWQWHHVVETNHLKPLYDPLRLEILHNEFTPCFLVSKEEHNYFSTNFHVGDSPWIAFDFPKPTHSYLQGSDRLTYINKLRRMYDAVYTGSDMVDLKKVAFNFLDFSIESI